MTQPVTFPFSVFQVLIGDGSTPEAFAFPCGFTQRSMKLTATAGETSIPDCNNEDAPVWTARDITGLSATVAGQGVTTVAAAPIWRAWALTGSKRNVRVGPANQPLSNDGGFYQGAAVLSSYEVVAEKGKRATVNVTLDSDGLWTWVPVGGAPAGPVGGGSGTASAPGGGPANTADFTDPNNAYLAALAA